jgi:hypothetical protein
MNEEWSLLSLSIDNCQGGRGGRGESEGEKGGFRIVREICTPQIDAVPHANHQDFDWNLTSPL